MKNNDKEKCIKFLNYVLDNKFNRLDNKEWINWRNSRKEDDNIVEVYTIDMIYDKFIKDGE